MTLHWLAGYDATSSTSRSKQRVAVECITMAEEFPIYDVEMAQAIVNGSRVRPGVIYPNMVPDQCNLILGNQLLLKLDQSYPTDINKKYKVRAHTVNAIIEALGNLQPPSVPERQPEFSTALDYFVGYVQLDAWIANQDRHHANWAAIEEQDGTLRLASTFDHAAGLARNLRDEERIDRLQTSFPARSISTFATKSKSACYLLPTDQRTLSTFDCLRKCTSRTRSSRCSENSETMLVVSALLFRPCQILASGSVQAGDWTSDSLLETGTYDWLARHFGHEVAETIRLQPLAMRFLATVVPKYFSLLNTDEQRIVLSDGGFMTANERMSFGKNRCHSNAMKIASWIDRGTDRCLEIPEMDFFHPFVEQAMVWRNS